MAGKDAAAVDEVVPAAVVVDEAPVEAPEAPAVTETTEAAPAVVDQVALVSYDADGRPAQSPGFVVLADPTDA